MAKQKKSLCAGQGNEDHSHMAYKGLRRMLYRKELVPGQKISCRLVADKLGMSITPVIQALKQMEFQGLIRHEPNRGYFMTPFRIEEVREIYELRQEIEPSLIPSTIKHLNGEGEKVLKSALEAHISAGSEAAHDNRLFRNAEFHLALASLSRMETHVRVLRQLYNLLILKYGGNYIPVAYTRSVDGEHQKIFDAVCAKDTETARARLASHISTVKTNVLDSAGQMAADIEVPEF